MIQIDVYICLMTNQYYSTKEVSALLNVSRATLDRWRKDKKIKARKIGRTVRYKLSDIEKAMK